MKREMIEDVSELFPVELGFSIRLTLSRLKGASRFCKFSRNLKLYKPIEEHYSSLEDLLIKHRDTTIEERDIYIIGSPGRNYKLAFKSDRIPHESLPVGIELQTYALFGEIVFD